MPNIEIEQSIDDAEVTLRLFRAQYGDLSEQEVLEGLKYADEYLVFLSAGDFRYSEFMLLSSTYRQWYELLHLVRHQVVTPDSCVVYQLHQQDYGEILKESNEVAKKLDCELYAFRTSGNLTRFLFHPKVVTVESLLEVKRAIKHSIAYWGSPPVVFSYLAAFPFKYDPNEKPKPGCGDCGLCNCKKTLE